jgi:16S rRNA (guanine1207-N2)-methyltransferase
MPTIALTDLPASECVRETFRNDTFRILSRSGLHPTERALIEALPTDVSGGILIAGNRTGATGLVLASENPRSAVAQHVYDIHHARPIHRAVSANAPDRIAVVCSPFLPEFPGAALAVVQATSHDTPAELILDQLEDLRAKLPAGTPCLIAYDGKPDWLRKQVHEIFGPVSASPAGKNVTLYRARTPPTTPPASAGLAPARPIPRARDFSATFPASLAGDPPLQLTTLPGVFAHRRPDEGGLALAEVASRDLTPDARVLDLGCGCGLVGLLLARHVPAETVLCADSSARAVHVTAANARANGLTCVRTLLTDETPQENNFTLFAGNPPYYADFQIAESFIRSAHQCLRPGGLAFIVAKNHRWHAGFMREIFGAVEVVKRRGYGVLKSVR